MIKVPLDSLSSAIALEESYFPGKRLVRGFLIA